MGRESNHREKWKRNRAFIETISDQYPEWVVTAAFYTALHLVEWLFASDGLDPGRDHDDRDNKLMNTRYDPIRGAYKTLKDASMTARYDATKNGRRSFTPENIKTTILGKYLKTIEDFVLAEVDPKQKHTPSPIQWPKQPKL